jgi:5-bromo-4-chloroindolyl phosphate hydrolysis protein
MSSNPIRGAPVSTTDVLAAVKGPLAKLRARLVVAKSAALFLLPLPLLIAIVAALVADDTKRLALSAGALACFWTAGVLVWRGLASEMRYLLGEQIDLDRIPRKLLSAVATAGGAALAALAAGHSPIGAATFATVGAVGHLCFYGLNTRARRVTVTPVAGLDVASVTGQLEHAHRRLRAIEAASRTIAVPEFRNRLARIIALGRQILDEIARDPRHASRTRRFLNLFLDSTQHITEEYARTHQGLRSRPLEDNFRTLLIEMEHAFSEQHRKLLDSGAVSLDVDIDVLNARLKQEAAGLYVEQRND